MTTIPETNVEREDRIRQELAAEGMGLLRRDDGYYFVIEDGDPIAPNGWRVRTWELNDRGGDIGSPYPLTLDWIEPWLSPNGT